MLIELSVPLEKEPSSDDDSTEQSFESSGAGSVDAHEKQIELPYSRGTPLKEADVCMNILIHVVQ